MLVFPTSVLIFQLLRAIKLSGPSNDVRLLEVSELTGPPEDSPLRNNSDGECVTGSVSIPQSSVPCCRARVVTDTAGTYGQVIPSVLLAQTSSVRVEGASVSQCEPGQ